MKPRAQPRLEVAGPRQRAMPEPPAGPRAPTMVGEEAETGDCTTPPANSAMCNSAHANRGWIGA